MSTIRVRSPASYWLAVPAAAWMLGVVVVPIVLLVWVSFWGGRAFSTASPLTFDNYAKFFANQTYLKLALTTIVHTATLMAVTGVLGYCIAYFLVMKVKSPGWRLALFLAFIVPFWTSTLIRAIAWVPFLGVNGVINQTLMYVGATQSPIEAFLYSRTGITMAQVSLYTMMAAGPVVYMLNAIAPQLREAAMTLKATPFVVFRRIVFPLTLPGVVIGQVLVFLNVMSDFATVATIGGNKHALLSNLVLLFYEGSQIRAASVVAVLLDDLHAGGRRGGAARRRHPSPGSRAMIGWPKIGWKGRLSLTGWILGTLTLVFLAYQWLPIFTLGLLSFSGPTGGTTFPMNGTSFHWYQEVWRATVMNDFKPPLVRSSLLALACSATTIVLSVMAAQAMRGQFRGNGWFFYLMLLGIMAPGILVGFGFAIMMRLMGVELSWDTTTFLVQVSWTLPFGFLTMLAVFNRFDKKVEEAALTLGASRMTTFRRITLPLVLPGVIGAGLFGFSLSYDEYARSMFTTGPDATLPLAVMAQLDRQLTPEIYAVGTATTFFSLVAVSFFTLAFWTMRRSTSLKKSSSA